jgi:class 3 adenylate cyclase
MKNTREISDFALGGQVLVSNSLMAASYNSIRSNADWAAIGSVGSDHKDGGGDDDEEYGGGEEEASDNMCVIQVLPKSLSKRLPEFVVMYAGNEHMVRPPAGNITCVFTYCHDGSTLGKNKSPLVSELDKLDEITEDCAEEYNGYMCKGSAGKFFFVFQTTGEALEFAKAIHMRLMATEWHPDLEAECPRTKKVMDASGNMTLNGLTLAIGIHSGEPTQFDYNKVTAKMDYFGQVVNRCARVMSTSAIGEISISSAAIGELREEDKVGYDLISRGDHQLKGVKGPMEITTMLPDSLKGRWDLFQEMRANGEIFSPGASSPGALSPGALSPGALSPTSD